MPHRRLWLLVLVVLAVLAAPAGAQARSRGLGRIRSDRTLGIGLGTGTFANGLSIKHFTGNVALQVDVGAWGGSGWDRWSRYGGVAGSFDVLTEMPALARGPVLRLGWNMGLGAGIGLDDVADTLGVAGAFVLGLEFELQPVPIDFVVEWRPKVGFLADPHVHGIGFDLVDVTAQLRVYLF